MSIINWRPELHPRNRMGQFREILGKLKSGDKVRLPDNTMVERRPSGRFRISAPGQRGYEVASVKTAARAGLSHGLVARGADRRKTKAAPAKKSAMPKPVPGLMTTVPSPASPGSKPSGDRAALRADLIERLTAEALSKSGAGTKVTDREGQSWIKTDRPKPLDAELGYNWIASDGPKRVDEKGVVRGMMSKDLAKLIDPASNSMLGVNPDDPHRLDRTILSDYSDLDAPQSPGTPEPQPLMTGDGQRMMDRNTGRTGTIHVGRMTGAVTFQFDDETQRDNMGRPVLHLVDEDFDLVPVAPASPGTSEDSVDDLVSKMFYHRNADERPLADEVSLPLDANGAVDLGAEVPDMTHAVAYLGEGGNLGVPASRWAANQDTASAIRVAIPVAEMRANDSGEPLRYRDLDSAMSQVVNDDDAIAYDLYHHVTGPVEGYDDGRAFLKAVDPYSFKSLRREAGDPPEMYDSLDAKDLDALTDGSLVVTAEGDTFTREKNGWVFHGPSSDQDRVYVDGEDFLSMEGEPELASIGKPDKDQMTLPESPKSPGTDSIAGLRGLVPFEPGPQSQYAAEVESALDDLEAATDEGNYDAVDSALDRARDAAFNGRAEAQGDDDDDLADEWNDLYYGIEKVRPWDLVPDAPASPGTATVDVKSDVPESFMSTTDKLLSGRYSDAILNTLVDLPMGASLVQDKDSTHAQVWVKTPDKFADDGYSFVANGRPDNEQMPNRTSSPDFLSAKELARYVGSGTITVDAPDAPQSPGTPAKSPQSPGTPKWAHLTVDVGKLHSHNKSVIEDMGPGSVVISPEGGAWVKQDNGQWFTIYLNAPPIQASGDELANKFLGRDIYDWIRKSDVEDPLTGKPFGSDNAEPPMSPGTPETPWWAETGPSALPPANDSARDGWDRLISDLKDNDVTPEEFAREAGATNPKQFSDSSWEEIIRAFEDGDMSAADAAKAFGAFNPEQYGKLSESRLWVQAMRRYGVDPETLR